MQVVKTITYFILGVVPATFMSYIMIQLPISVVDAFRWPGLMPYAGAIGLWLATFDFIFRSNKVRLVIVALLILGIAAMSPFSIGIITDVILNGADSKFLPKPFSISGLVGALIIDLALITPVLIGVHYIWRVINDYASNNRLQSDAAPPRA